MRFCSKKWLGNGLGALVNKFDPIENGIFINHSSITVKIRCSALGHRFPKTFSQIADSSPTFLIESKAGIRYSHLHRGMSRCFTLVAYIMFSKVRLHPETMSHVATHTTKYCIVVRFERTIRVWPRQCWGILKRGRFCVCVCEALYKMFTHWHITICFYTKDWDEFFFIKYWKINHWEQVDLSYMNDRKDEFFRKYTMW